MPEIYHSRVARRVIVLPAFVVEVDKRLGTLRDAPAGAAAPDPASRFGAEIVLEHGGDQGILRP
jgi:hypothetical protein